LEKEEYDLRIQALKDKLNNLNTGEISREEIDKSIGLLPINDKSGRKIALTFDDRVKSFESHLDEKNKQAEEFVKKM
jgi:hypothetical protein